MAHLTEHLNSDSPRLFSPALAAMIGLDEAILLQQLHYWLKRSENDFEGCRWVYNSYEEWQSLHPWWSVSTIRRILTSLEEQGLIRTSQPRRHEGDCRKWYTIKYDHASPSAQIEHTPKQMLTPKPQNGQRGLPIPSTPSGQTEQSLYKEAKTSAENSYKKAVAAQMPSSPVTQPSTIHSDGTATTALLRSVGMDEGDVRHFGTMPLETAQAALQRAAQYIAEKQAQKQAVNPRAIRATALRERWTPAKKSAAPISEASRMRAELKRFSDSEINAAVEAVKQSDNKLALAVGSTAGITNPLILKPVYHRLMRCGP